MDKKSVKTAAILLPCVAVLIGLVYFIRVIELSNPIVSNVIDCIILLVYSTMCIYYIWKARKTFKIYQDILRDAFRNDKRSRRALRKMFQEYSVGGQGLRLLKRLDKLESTCADNADYAAVSMLRALCYGEMGKTDEAARYCEAVEQYGFTIPDAAKDAIFHPKTLSFKRKTGC